MTKQEPDKLQNAIETIVEAHDTLSKELTQSKQHCSNLRQELETTQHELREALKQVAELQTQNEALNEKYNAAKKSCAKLDGFRKQIALMAESATADTTNYKLQELLQEPFTPYQSTPQRVSPYQKGKQQGVVLNLTPYEAQAKVQIDANELYRRIRLAISHEQFSQFAQIIHQFNEGALDVEEALSQISGRQRNGGYNGGLLSHEPELAQQMALLFKQQQSQSDA